MKPQHLFTLLFTTFLAALWIIPNPQAFAQKKQPDKNEIKGLILFDFPNPPEPIVEVNLTEKLINLVTKSVSATPDVAELIQMIEGIFVRTYESDFMHEKELQKLIDYYQMKLKKQKWEVLVRIKEKDDIVEISLLYDEDVAYGIFVIVRPAKSKEVTFINIVGEIAPERISELLGNLSNFGMKDIDLNDTLKVKVELNPDRDTAKKEILAVKTDKPPKIDGKLDDACWKIAPKTDEFTHVSTEKPVEDQTIVKLLYTDKSIYVGWYLHDADPEKIVALKTNNHPRFANEDSVCFSIDPFHTHSSDHRTLFMVNPLGKKKVSFVLRRAKDYDRINKWKVATQTVKDGWIVEMEIPWQILDYPDTSDPIQMGINFERKHQRTGENSWWSNIGDEKVYKNDGNWLQVLPPSKSSLMQGMIDAFEKDKHRVLTVSVDDKDIYPPARDHFRLLNTSGLNPVDGLRLGGGFELGQRWYSDPYFFERSGETIRRNVDTNLLLTSDDSNFGLGSSITPNPFLFGTMSLALRSTEPNFRLGTGLTFGDRSHLTFATQIHMLTSVRDRDILLSGSEQFLRAFFDTDFQDYYLRQGGVMTMQWQNSTLKHNLGLSLLVEEHVSVYSGYGSPFRNWSFGDYPGEFDISPIDDGRMHSITLKYDFDNRENTGITYDLANKPNRNEWYNTFLVEHSNTAIGSDFDFTRFVAHLRNYHPIRDNRLDTRLKVGFSTSTDPLPYQRQFVLGGTGTLRGYSLYEFEGNHGYLFNLEYVHRLARGVHIVPFVDIGQTTEDIRDIVLEYPKVNLGVGFQLSIFRLNLARSIERDRGYQVNFKWSRTF